MDQHVDLYSDFGQILYSTNALNHSNTPDPFSRGELNHVTSCNFPSTLSISKYYENHGANQGEMTTGLPFLFPDSDCTQTDDNYYVQKQSIGRVDSDLQIYYNCLGERQEFMPTAAPERPTAQPAYSRITYVDTGTIRCPLPCQPIVIPQVSTEQLNEAHDRVDGRRTQRAIGRPTRFVVQSETYGQFDDQDQWQSASDVRRAAMMQRLGFTPTDPDGMTCHEKKRYYFESLEHYIMYLRKELEFIGAVPEKMERIDSYEGITTRSIRILLSHMEIQTRNLHGHTTKEEQKFYNLRNNINLLQETEIPKIFPVSNS